MVLQLATAEGADGDDSYPLSMTRAATSSVDTQSGQRMLDRGKTARVAMGSGRCWEVRGCADSSTCARGQQDSPSIAAVLLVDVS